MKEQQFENFDSFNLDEWNPVDDKTFHFRVNNELYGWFSFDKEWGIWRGRIAENTIYKNPDELDIRGVSKLKNDIRSRLEKWGIFPECVVWHWSGHRFQVGDYSDSINNIISPEPYMVYKTYEIVEGCEVKTQYYLERVTRAVYLEIEKTIRNDDIDLPKLWEVFIDQMKKRIHEPFTAKLGTTEEFIAK